jgi:hypothetical protein
VKSCIFERRKAKSEENFPPQQNESIIVSTLLTVQPVYNEQVSGPKAFVKSEFSL